MMTNISGYERNGKIMRYLLVITVLLFPGCGFHLRGQENMPFQAIYIQAANPGTLFANALRRNLTANKVTVVEEAEQADVVLEIVYESSDKQVLTLGGDGRVNEFRLNYRVSLRAYDLKQRVWLPAEELVQRRDFSFDDTQILAKEAEETLLQKNMRADMVREIMRRLSNAKPQQQ